MEANNIFKKIFKSLKIDKNNSHNLSKQKKNVKSLCCTNLKYAFSIFLFLWGNVSWKPWRKRPNLELTTIFFSREKQKDRVSITMETASKVSSYASLLHLHNICIMATKWTFNLSYRVLRSQNQLNTHYLWNRQDFKHKNGNPKGI